MKTLLYKKLLLTLFFTWILSAGWGQQMHDSLVKYLEISAKNNPALLQRFNEYKAALQKVTQAGSLSDPELSLGFFLEPMELVSGNQVADIRLMQMFPWFGVLKSARDEMSLMAKAKYELFRDASLQVYYEVQNTWYELFKVQKNISISERNLEILETIERLAIIKFQAAPVSGAGSAEDKTSFNVSSSLNSGSGTSGMQNMGGSKVITSGSIPIQSSQSMQSGSMGSSPGLTDLYRIQIESGDLMNSIAMLKNQYNTIVAQFNSYLNRPAATSVFVPGSLPLDTLTIPLTAISDTILARNPMLNMLEFEKQSYEARGKMVKNMGYPMVGLGLNYSLINTNEMSASSMNGKDMIMPMISVTLPVYRRKYNSMVTETKLLKASASNNYTATANSLQIQYYQAIQLYKDASRRVSLYDNQSKLASQTLDLVIKSFAASASSLTDLLRVRQQTLDYELKQAEAIADLNTASALLKRLMASSPIN